MSPRQLLLMRHGKALPAEHGQRDHDRALAPRGIANANQQALAILPQASDAMLVSDAVRTRQTADILVDTWTSTGNGLPLRRDTPSGYLASAEQWMDLLSMEADAHNRIWVVGHNPGISELVWLLSGTPVAMATADVVHLDLDLAHWAEIGPHCARLRRHLPGRGH